LKGEGRLGDKAKGRGANGDWAKVRQRDLAEMEPILTTAIQNKRKE